MQFSDQGLSIPYEPPCPGRGSGVSRNARGAALAGGLQDYVRMFSTDPLESAIEAGLRYDRCCRNCIRRIRSGKGFRYVGPDDKPVRDEKTLARIRSLVIPPAWKNVSICSSPLGHLQAVGTDAKGRKQYRYH